MNLETLISSNAVLNAPDIKSKKRALEILAETLAAGLSASSTKGQAEVSAENPAEMNAGYAEYEQSDSDETPESINALEIFELLTEREKLGSTSMGHGVALPHARTKLTDTAIAAFLKLDKGIDFDSPDQQATDLVFALLVPEHYTDEHLKILAYLASLFSDENFCNAIRNVNNSQSIYENLINWQLTSQAS